MNALIESLNHLTHEEQVEAVNARLVQALIGIYNFTKIDTLFCATIKCYCEAYCLKNGLKFWTGENGGWVGRIGFILPDDPTKACFGIYQDRLIIINI